MWLECRRWKNSRHMAMHNSFTHSEEQWSVRHTKQRIPFEACIQSSSSHFYQQSRTTVYLGQFPSRPTTATHRLAPSLPAQPWNSTIQTQQIQHLSQIPSNRYLIKYFWQVECITTEALVIWIWQRHPNSDYRHVVAPNKLSYYYKLCRRSSRSSLWYYKSSMFTERFIS